MRPRLSLLSLMLCLPTFAQEAEFGISGGWGGFRNNAIGTAPQFGAAPDEFSIDNGVRIGGRMAFNSWEHFGHEMSYAYQRSRLRALSDFGDQGRQEQDFGGMTIQNVYYNAVLHATPNGSSVRPFVTGGGGFSSFFPPGTSSLGGRGSTKFGYNYGAGLKFNLSKYGIRFDVRNHVTGKPFDEFIPNVSGTLNNIEYSMTFSFLF